MRVLKLTTPSQDRRFRLTNPEDYLADLQRPGRWPSNDGGRAAGRRSDPTLCRERTGCSPRAERRAAGAQVATVGSPPASFAPGVTFGQDPNDLTNARGRLPNDRPHMLRVMSVGRRAAHRLGGRGQPAAPQRQALGEDGAHQPERECATRADRAARQPNGCRRRPCSTSASRERSSLGGIGRVELCLDVLNALNDTAEESIRNRGLQRARPSVRPASSSIRAAR